MAPRELNPDLLKCYERQMQLVLDLIANKENPLLPQYVHIVFSPETLSKRFWISLNEFVVYLSRTDRCEPVNFESIFNHELLKVKNEVLAKINSIDELIGRYNVLSTKQRFQNEQGQRMVADEIEKSKRQRTEIVRELLIRPFNEFGMQTKD